MTDARLRGPHLVRYLLASAFPAALAVVLPLPGCACAEQTSTFPIDPDDHQAMLERYGSEALPTTQCERLCVVEAPLGMGGAGGSGGGSAEPQGFDSISECSLTTIEFSEPAVECTGLRECGGAGRRPPGLRPAEGDSQEGGKAGRSDGSGSERKALGDYFAAMAHLEAASVLAFQHLAGELRRHGAPAGLVRRARRAAVDEMRHASVTAALARRHGAVVPKVRAHLPGLRSLEAIAIDNAVEGCVGESYGAALLADQAGRARDASLARALATIASDEATHAELSFELADWLTPRLGARGRRRVRDAGERALDARSEAAVEPHPELARRAGVPSAARDRALVERVRVLWVSGA